MISPKKQRFINYIKDFTNLNNRPPTFVEIMNGLNMKSLGTINWYVNELEKDGSIDGCQTHPHNTHLQILTETGIVGYFLFILIYIISGTVFLSSFYNSSYWLIDNGNGGFVGRIIRENIYYFAPIIDNEYFIYGLLLFTIIFFILSLSIKPNEIIKIFFFPFILIKKISEF